MYDLRCMPRKRPPPSWVFEAWRELVLDKGDKLSLEERHRRWADLYSKTFHEGVWTVPADDAALVARLGWTIHMNKKQYETARDLLRAFMSHPAYPSEVDATTYTEIVVCEATADILCSNVSGGVERLRAELHRPGRDRSARHSVRNSLCEILWTLSPDKEADPAIRGLAADTIALYPGKKRLTQWARTCESNQDLLEALAATCYLPLNRQS